MSCRAGRARPVSLWKPGFVELPVSISFLGVSRCLWRSRKAVRQSCSSPLGPHPLPVAPSQPRQSHLTPPNAAGCYRFHLASPGLRPLPAAPSRLRQPRLIPLNAAGSGWFPVHRASRFAPAPSSAVTASAVPPNAAECSGVRPLSSRASRSAPAPSSAVTTSAAPTNAAECSGVLPLSSRASRFAPAPSSAVTTASPLSPNAAGCSGVLPLSSRASRFCARFQQRRHDFGTPTEHR